MYNMFVSKLCIAYLESVLCPQKSTSTQTNLCVYSVLQSILIMLGKNIKDLNLENLKTKILKNLQIKTKKAENLKKLEINILNFKT